MSPCRNHNVLLLFLSASTLLHLFAHAASPPPPITRPRIIIMGYDDNEYDNPGGHETASTMSPPTLLQEPRFCAYDPCLENQTPCAQLSAKTGCLCPGLSGANEPPHAPRIKALTPISAGADSGKVEVQWCAPSSVVSGYTVAVEGMEAREFGEARRRGVVGSLDVGTKVCVEAVNNAGHSVPSDYSCQRYEQPDSLDHQTLAGLLGGGITLLLLIIIAALIFWKYQMKKKANRDSSDGLGNPSYNTEGTL